MNEADALDLIQAAIWTIIVGSGPAVAAAMAVGLIVAVIQALTQVQEMTLTFVPKIVVMFVALLVLLPFMLSSLTTFTERMMDRIVALG